MGLSTGRIRSVERAETDPAVRPGRTNPGFDFAFKIYKGIPVLKA